MVVVTESRGPKFLSVQMCEKNGLVSKKFRGTTTRSYSWKITNITTRENPHLVHEVTKNSEQDLKRTGLIFHSWS